MKTLFLQDSRLKVSVNDGQLVVSQGGEIMGSYPLVPLERVVLFGNPQMTTQAVKACLSEGIEIQYYSAYGKYLGMIQPTESKNRARRLQQYRLAVDPEKSLNWSRRLICSKLKGCEVEYRRIVENRWHKASQETSRELKRLGEAAGRAVTLDELRGIEGLGAKVWFSFWGGSLPSGWEWNGRSHHPAQDEVNALLSLIYALSANEIEKQCRQHGLDPAISFMHVNTYGSGGLAYDLLESMRASICDHAVLKALHQRKFLHRDFHHDGTGWRLSETGWRKAVKWYDSRLHGIWHGKNELLLSEVVRGTDDFACEPEFSRFLPDR